MKSIQPSNPVNLNDLIMAYLRFKEWMDYDLERSAYCAKEIIVMQTLFKTAYIKAPPNLVDASYGELLSVMEERQTLINDFHEAVYNSTDEDRLDDVLTELDKSTFKSTIHYFTTLHEAIFQAAGSVSFEDGSNPEKYTIDAEPFEDHFEEMNGDLIEDIRAFIISEHPRIESITFPVEKVYALGLLRRAPEPIDHGPTTVN